MRLAFALLFVALGAGCGSDGISLVVDLKTDLAPGVEFSDVRTELVALTAAGEPDLDSVRLRELLASGGDDYLTGARVAEYEELTMGAYRLRVTLQNARGVTVVDRDLRITADATLGVTVVMTRDCRGVTCADGVGDVALASCLAGRCVDPGCLEGNEDACPDPECAVDTDCVASVGCATGRCNAGVCLFGVEASACAEGEWCSPEGGCMRLPGMETEDCTPVVEACNGVDDDCDAIADEGFDFDIDVTNCGACGASCNLANAMVQCVSGTCGVAACTLGFGDCDGEATTGCETPLNTAANCARCGRACTVAGGTAGCSAGNCVVASCEAGVADCTGGAADGCETDLRTPSNCGGCGVNCPDSTPLCSSVDGAFECVNGCGAGAPTLCGMSCVNTDTDTNNCGNCGDACTTENGTPECSSGSCALGSCDAGYEDCNGATADGCEEALTQLNHCGGCGVTCDLANAAESCATGTCQITSCQGNYGNCDGIESTGCETLKQIYYRDMDMDGFGDPMVPSPPSCAAPPGYVASNDDCDDMDMSVGDAQPETCNGMDDDCDGLIDEDRYGIVRELTISHPDLGTSSSEPPDIAFDGSEIGVIWHGTARDGGADDELFFARVGPDLGALIESYRLTDTPNNITTVSASLEWEGQWLVAHTYSDGADTEGQWAWLPPGSYYPSFSGFGARSWAGWIARGDPGRLFMSRGSSSAFAIDMLPFIPISGPGTAAPLESSAHGENGLVAVDPGRVGYGQHTGPANDERLAYFHKDGGSGMTLAEARDLTPGGSTNGGPVDLYVSNGRVVIVTQTDWAGGPHHAVLAYVNSDATSPNVVHSAADTARGIGQSAQNESFGYTANDKFYMRTFGNQVIGSPIMMPRMTRHRGIGGTIGPHAYVIAYANDSMGVHLVGIGCM